MPSHGNILEYCPHCGSPKLRDDPPDRRLTYIEYQIVSYLNKHRVATTPELWNRIYAHRPDGGPSPNIIAVYISRINRKNLGYEIRATKRGPGAHYTLRRKDPPV